MQNLISKIKRNISDVSFLTTVYASNMQELADLCMEFIAGLMCNMEPSTRANFIEMLHTRLDDINCDDD